MVIFFSPFGIRKLLGELFLVKRGSNSKCTEARVMTLAQCVLPNVGLFMTAAVILFVKIAKQAWNYFN